ncbi:NHL repeat-containing protein [Gemmatimonas aurantiaca]|uniref:NHL repeat-containing protein n=1 Tax=Gemmatimonas aurantiaca TaxID=173480 RepID=UPI00301C20AF
MTAIHRTAAMSVPIRRLGAASPFGLALPSAQPTAGQLYAPRGVWFDDHRVIVADSGNHRVLIWHAHPTVDGADADVVLGQPDFESEGPAAGGRGCENGLHLPTGVLVYQDRLLVADAWHHRILVWNAIPTHSDTPPSYAIGQPTLADAMPNAGGSIDGNTLYWPYGLGIAGGWFWIADTGNRRVLGWPYIPEPGDHAQIVLGQDDPSRADENRGGPPSACSFRWPHAISGDARTLFVADAGNHRILGWTPVPDRDRPADLVLGQQDFERNEELPHRPQGAHRLRFPYAVAAQRDMLVVADTANNRVLRWHTMPRAGVQRPADEVLGQSDFDAAGENRWTAVTDDTLCWPYGLWLNRDRLAIADSGNNRVMFWSLGTAPTTSRAEV